MNNPLIAPPHLSQEEVDRRLFGREFLQLDELGQRVVVPLGREEDGRALELAQRALGRQPEEGFSRFCPSQGWVWSVI